MKDMKDLKMDLFSSFEEEAKKPPYTMEELDQILIYLDRQNSNCIHEFHLDDLDNTSCKRDLKKMNLNISD